MLRNKTFNKKTSKGKVVSVIKEHYLRDDIYCSIKGCNKCPADQMAGLDMLEKGKGDNKLMKNNHYLIPDTNVVVNQLDFLEQIDSWILLSTVGEEVRNLSSKAYTKVKTWLADPSRKVVSFSNEHHRDTYIERLPQESPNDRNDRAIRVACKWYQDHLESEELSVVMLSDDVDNRCKAKASGLNTFSVSDYAKNMVGRPELADLIAAPTDFKEKEEVKYTEYISNLAMTSGIKSGRYLQGTLNISTHNYLEGSIFAKVDDKEGSVLIVGRPDLNRSIHGDVVCVELLPRDQWGSADAVVITNEEDEKLLEKEKKVVKEDKKEDEFIQPKGKVVGVVKRNWRPYCGFLDKTTVHGTGTSSTGQTQNVLFFALDSRIPKVRLRTRQAHALLHQRIIVAVDSWPIDSKFPTGHFVRSLGEAGDKDTETEVLLLEHEVPHHEFSPQVLACLPSEGNEWIVKPEHLTNRMDLRGLDVCSIDPPGCTDIDDALHARLLPNGNFEVGVHIADVTHFVKPGNAMDKEASDRCTSVYLVNQRIDMLPSLLGTNLCSLRSDVDRLSFSCLWEMTPDAQIVDTKFSKSVIRSKRSFTYEAAQLQIDDPTKTDPLTEGVRTLNRFAKLLKARRLEAGALTLSSPEVRFALENESQDPVDVEMKELQDTNALVEEFMLLANISVARKIYDTFPLCALLRSHPTPPPSNFEQLNRALARLDVALSYGSSKQLADSLDLIQIESDPYLNKLVRILTTRCMMQARYFSSGSVPFDEFKHYGLATDIYTHFTSPIRRFSDVIVHRLLHAAIDKDHPLDASLLNKAGMEEQCKTLNHRHRMAQQAARGSVELFTHLYFKDKTMYEPAYVIRVVKNGFVVLVPKFGIESIVHVQTDDQAITYKFEEQDQTLLFDNDVKVTMFDKVEVELSIKKALKGGGEGGLKQSLQIKLISPVIEGLSVTKLSPSVKRTDQLNNGSEVTTKLRKLNVKE